MSAENLHSVIAYVLAILHTVAWFYAFSDGKGAAPPPVKPLDCGFPEFFCRA